jgi:hypothetical protein
LDAKTEFRTTDSIAELRDFRRDDLCILTGGPAGAGLGEHCNVDSRNGGAECKEL